MTSRSLRTMTTAVAVTAMLALSACGDGGGPGPTEGSERESGATSTSGTTAAAEESPPKSSSSTSTDTGTPFDSKEFTSRMEKAVEANPTVAIDVDVTLGGEQEVSAKGVQDLANNALEMDVEMGGQELGYRLVDGDYYLAQPPKWVPVTKDSTNPVIQQTLEQVQLLSMRKQFDAFVAGVVGAGDKGSEEIDGVATTHYTATVDLAEATEALGQENAEGAPETVIYDVWLDEDDLIRQMTFEQDGSVATMTASDWGEPVAIERPKDSEIAEASDPGTS